MMTAISGTKWDPALYDDKHSFVTTYGEDLVNLLDPKPRERILDLGCGTGYLTDVIAGKGAVVTGIDNSKEMIEKARSAYPALNFQVLSATSFQFENRFDAIFSNAALHWVLDKEKAIECIYTNLKPNGRLVLEMGGKDNVNSILNACHHILNLHGYSENSVYDTWYFPSLGEYSSLLEKRGFRVTYAVHYDRQTPLKDQDTGIKDWIRMFGNSFLLNIPELELDSILQEIQDKLKPTNYINGQWIADYKRLRLVAFK